MIRMNKQKAFGLVEFMLGLFLGTCLLTLMIRHYLTIKQLSLDTAHVLAEAYDQQLISELIQTSIRQAGFTPCAPIRWLTTHEVKPLHSLQAIVLNAGEKKALQISRMSENFSIIQEIISKKQVVLGADLSFKMHASVLIADCFHAEIKTIESIQRKGLDWHVRFNTPLHHTYTPPIYIGEWLQERFFIDKNNQGEDALYYQLKHAEELSSQIKGLSVKLETRGVKQLIAIDFLLSQEKTWHLETTVRV